MNDNRHSNNEYGIQVYGADINPAPRCACALLLDISGSMQGDPIDQLNAGVEAFFHELLHDDFARFSVETGIVTFGNGYHQVDVTLPFTACNDITSVGVPRFQAGGTTPMGKAIHAGLDLLDERKGEYKRTGIAYYQPWMVLLTDGEPNDEWEAAARQAQALCAKRRLVFLGVGVGDKVDMETLGRICPANRPPQRLQGLKFVEFFEWLSQSMGTVSRSSVGDGSINLPPIDGWAAVEN